MYKRKFILFVFFYSVIAIGFLLAGCNLWEDITSGENEGGIHPPQPVIGNSYGEAAWGPNNWIVCCHTPWRVDTVVTEISDDFIDSFIVSDSGGLWLIKPDGPVKSLLAAGAYECPDWSPDGGWIVCSDLEGRLWCIEVEGDSIFALTEDGKRWYPSFDPTGEKLLFARHMGADSGGIWILDLLSGHERRITPFGDSPDFSPSGDKFVCFGWEESYKKPVLKIVDTLGSTVKVLVSEFNFVHYPSFSPDGSMIVFDTGGGDPCIWVINADGTGLRRLVRHGRTPSFSPDGQKIVYVRYSTHNLHLPGNGKLWIVNIDGSNNHQLTF